MAFEDELLVSGSGMASLVGSREDFGCTHCHTYSYTRFDVRRSERESVLNDCKVLLLQLKVVIKLKV